MGHSMRIGSLGWARRRGGQLSLADRLSFFASAVQSRIKRRLRLSGDTGIPLSSALNLESLRHPQSRLVERTFELCQEAYEPWLLNHCLRTYLWGGLIGQAERVPVNLEDLLIASLLHDLGLTKTPPVEQPCDCFAVRGGLYAEKFLSEQGASPLLASRSAESISMHLNISVRPSDDPVPYLLHQGAAVDVVGWGMEKIRSMKDPVLRRHPRLDFKSKFCGTLAREAQRHAGTRLSMMVRFGFLDLIRQAPYEE